MQSKITSNYAYWWKLYQLNSKTNSHGFSPRLLIGDEIISFVFSLTSNINCKWRRNDPAQHKQYDKGMSRSTELLFDRARSETFTPLQTVAEQTHEYLSLFL